MIEPLVRVALLEDLGRAGDLTTNAIVRADARATTLLVARQQGVIAGLDLAGLACRLIGVFLRGLRASPPTSPRTRRTAIRTSFDKRGRDLTTARATAMAPISAAMIASAR